MSSCIKVKGFRNIIHWQVTRYDEPKLIELSGAGRRWDSHLPTIEVQEASPGSRFHVLAELRGGLLSTRIGQLVARVLQSEVRKSVNNLAAFANPIRGSWHGIRTVPRRYRYRPPSPATAR